ncbi:MAG: P-loop containing nucleoside triphosphate hydrolase protein [Piptocephalis tieghemiana]|nr:MAG: P-loop containing nucleoside triphosphate hydrolase protein [Piptocephalis tieghemiana]
MGAWSEHLTLRIALHAVGLASAEAAPIPGTPTTVHSRHLRDAIHTVETHFPSPSPSPSPSSSTDTPTTPIQKLDQYEKKLLPALVNPDTLETRFSDVCTRPRTLRTLQTLITLPLLRPDLFASGILAKHHIGGVLLFGPPGTGKTMLARAVAKESGSAVLEVRGSDVFQKYVGEGESTVRAIFSLARKVSPCVIFLDEVDAIFAARSGEKAQWSRTIINQFMLEWDGLASTNKGVVVMGATNRPFDLDDAVLRRMPRRILVDLPGLEERKRILDLHLKGENLGEGVTTEWLAQRTDHYSGSDLKHLCVTAALAAVQEQVIGQAALSREEILDLDALRNSSTSSQDTLPPSTERVVEMRHVEGALQEVGPSCSDGMSSLVDLRKWDDEYGEGGKRRGAKPVWGFGVGERGKVRLEKEAGKT